MLRFRKVTENNDDNISVSSRDSQVGCINWVKKDSDEKEFSSISGSALDLKPVTSESSCSDDDFNDEYSEDIEFEPGSVDESIEFGESEEVVINKARVNVF